MLGWGWMSFSGCVSVGGGWCWWYSSWSCETNERTGFGFLSGSMRTAWVNHPTTTPQLLFIRRTTRPTDRYSSHIAFPGGRSEPSDKSSHYTALRETWEEIGVDLAEREFGWVGRLDDREITTSLGKRLLMVLSPFGEYWANGGVHD